MNDYDPNSPKASNPFYVPDRTREMLGFFAAGAISALLPLSFGLPPSAKNLAIIVSFALLALMALLAGLKARRHRLGRLQSAIELRRLIERPFE